MSNGNVSFQFSTTALISIQDQLNDEISNYEMVINDISNSLNELNSNIDGTTVNRQIATIIQTLEAVKETLKSVSNELITFLSNQDYKYSSTYSTSFSNLSAIVNQINNMDS